MFPDVSRLLQNGENLTSLILINYQIFRNNIFIIIKVFTYIYKKSEKTMLNVLNGFKIVVIKFFLGYSY